MSRIGRMTIEVPSGVQLDIKPEVISAKGPKGTLTLPRHKAIEVKLDGKELVFTRTSEEKPVRAAHGLMRALTANLIKGVTAGFERKLEINGVGYRAEVKGDVLNLSLGFSHPINFQLPAGISVEVEKMTKLKVLGIDKELVGQTAAYIRQQRKPEPYKGKGIRYAGEVIRRKAGKAGKVGGA